MKKNSLWRKTISLVLTALLSLTCLAVPAGAASTAAETPGMITLKDNPLPVALPAVELPVPAPAAPKMLKMAASSNVTPANLAYTLYPGESAGNDVSVTIPAVPPQADVVFAFDLTGSMGGILNTAKVRSAEIMNQIAALGSNVQYGVMSYMDYPGYFNSYGYYSQYGSAGSGDYPYQLNRSITGDNAAVTSAISGLSLGYGADGPEAYTRPLYESYADPGVGWRTGTKRILVNFGDDIPHDNNINEGLYGYPQSTGGDPGRDGRILTADDLDLQAVLQEMARNNIVLLACQTGGDYSEYWDYWAGITGGDVYNTSSDEMADQVVKAITAELTKKEVYNLHLAGGSPYTSWVATFPASYDKVPTGETRTFAATFTVPEGTPAGTYEFDVDAIDGGNVSYGKTHVVITVPEGAAISPAKAVYDTHFPKEIAVNMNTKGLALNGIKEGSAALNPGTDYTVSGDAVTFSKGYLAGLSGRTQPAVLNFDFSKGTDPALTVYVADFRNLAVSGLTKPFNGVSDVVQASDGSIYVSDYYNNRIVRLTGTGAFVRAYGMLDPVGGFFSKPCGLAIDSSDGVYVADSGNNRIVRFQDDNQDGVLDSSEYQIWGGTKAGAGVLEFNKPCGLCLNGDWIIAADTGNHRIASFKNDDAADTWKTFGSQGGGDGQMKSPYDAAVDSKGDIWVSDTLNQRVQHFNGDGTFIEKFAVNYPYGISIGNGDDVLVAERLTGMIRWVNENITFAGKGKTDGQFTNPVGVFTDCEGLLWVADITANKVQKTTFDYPLP